MSLNFPSSPTLGDEYSANSKTWVWTGNRWEPKSFSATGSGSGILTLDNELASSATHYPTLVTKVSGEEDVLTVSSTKLTFNPASGELSSTSFNSLSDVAYKENFKHIDQVFEILKQIDVYEFDWQETKQKSYGVIAQELETIMPELVAKVDDKRYVNYLPLIAILIECCKQLISQYERLQK